MVLKLFRTVIAFHYVDCSILTRAEIFNIIPQMIPPIVQQRFVTKPLLYLGCIDLINCLVEIKHVVYSWKVFMVHELTFHS